MKKGFMPLIAILVVASLLTGFTGKKEQDPKASLEGRIKLLEAEIVELRSLLRKNPGMKLGVIQDNPGPELEPRAFLDGTRAWIEDGVNMWTAMDYNVGINTAFAPAFDLDINGDMNIAGGINDGVTFGLVNDVLVSDGLGGVQWGASPGGSADYIWNQDTAQQSPANFWISGWGEADAGFVGLINADLGVGIYGKNFSAIGTGIAGSGNNTDPIVLASGSGVAGSGPNVGVFGNGDATSQSWGIFGVSDATDGAGVVGAGTSVGGAQWLLNSGVSGTSDDVGVYGYGSTTSGSYGVYGDCAAADGYAVGAWSNGIGVIARGDGVGAWQVLGSGVSATSDNIGIYARGDDTADSWGLYARSSGSSGVGAFARSNANPSWAFVGASATSTAYVPSGDCGLAASGLWAGGIGYGQAAGSGIGLIGVGDYAGAGYTIWSGAGVSGYSSTSVGVFGLGDADCGVIGLTYGSTYAAVQAGDQTSTTTTGLLALANQNYRAIEAAGGNNFAVNHANAEFVAGFWNTPTGNGDYEGIYVGGNCIAYGYWTHLKSSKGDDISASAMLSPDANVVITGTSKLRDGKATVSFDETFKELISSDFQVNIIATPTEECNGVFVSEVSNNGFTVKELMSGRNTASFNWIAIGRRKGCEERRVYAEQYPKSETSRGSIKVTDVKSARNAETKEDLEVKESKIKKVTPRDVKGIDLQKGSLESEELEKKKVFE